VVHVRTARGCPFLEGAPLAREIAAGLLGTGSRTPDTGIPHVDPGACQTDFSQPCPMSMSGLTSVTVKLAVAWIMAAASSPATFAISRL